MDKENKYIIKGGEEGKKRLEVIAEILNNGTKKLLAPEGVSIQGKYLLDVGCGGGSVSLMASEMVGNTGSVTAVDFDDEIIKLATSDANALGLSNVEFKTQNVYDLDFENTFDIAYSRFLLSHLEEPLTVLDKMLRAVKPGGKIIIEDIDFSGHFCQPNCDDFDIYLHLFSAAARRNGQNPDIGLSLFEMFTQCGIENIQLDLVQPYHNKGPGKWMAYHTMEKIKDTVVKQGLATPDEVQIILLGLKRFTEDTDSIISLPRIFRVWGTKSEPYIH